jgi:hypothetical protein
MGNSLIYKPVATDFEPLSFIRVSLTFRLPVMRLLVKGQHRLQAFWPRQSKAEGLS